MSRRKGELTSARIERDWREQVEFPAGERCARPVVNTMHDFCQGQDMKACTIRSPAGEFILLWCFKTPGDAAAFHARFGGSASPRPMR